MSQFQISPFDLSHVLQAQTLHESAFSKAWGKDFFQNAIDDKNKISLVVIQNNQVIGIVIFQIIKPEAEIITICIDEKFRNQGIGRMLLKKSLEIIISNDYNNVFLEVRADNLAAISLYESLGFTTINVRKNYYKTNASKKLDALVMNKSLKNNSNSVCC